MSAPRREHAGAERHASELLVNFPQNRGTRTLAAVARKRVAAVGRVPGQGADKDLGGSLCSCGLFKRPRLPRGAMNAGATDPDRDASEPAQRRHFGGVAIPVLATCAVI